MEWLKKYWPMIIMAVSIVSSTTAAQVQVSDNKADIEEIKSDIKKFEEQRVQQAIIETNQQNMKDDLKEIKDLLRSLK